MAEKTYCSVPLNIPTVFQASDMLDQLKTFSLEKGHASMLTLVSQLLEELAVIMNTSTKQTQITDFFTRPI